MPRRSTPVRQRQISLVENACRLIERSENPPSLDDLAREANLSRYHFHRLFKGITGLTPKAYAAAHRAGRVRQQLHQRETVTEALYEAGFNSSGRFYAGTSRMLGMKPNSFRQGGVGETIRFAIAECSLGSVLVASSERGICAIFLSDDPDEMLTELQKRFSRAELIGGDPEYEALVAKVIGFIEAPRIGFDLPLDIRGTAFQQKVWEALQEIPVGTTLSYTELAGRLGFPKAVRAVAGACAANSIAVAIPCHRVVKSNGSISGYRWGVDRKRALLTREGASPGELL